MGIVGTTVGCRVNGVIVGILDVGKVCIPVVIVSLQTMASIYVMVWLTRSTPSLPLGL